MAEPFLWHAKHYLCDLQDVLIFNINDFGLLAGSCSGVFSSTLGESWPVLFN